MNVDSYLDRTRASGYDCMALASDVWQELTGRPLRAAIAGTARGRALAGKFTRLAAPVSPCIVLMVAGPRTLPHIGIFYEGRLLHLGRNVAEYIPLSFVTPLFKRIRYYKCD